MYFRLRKQKDILAASLLPLTLLFTAASALPLVVIPGRAGYISLLDGRHLYLPSIFLAIAISVLVWGMYSAVRKSRIGMLGLIVLMALFFLQHSMKIRRDIALQAAIGNQRQKILTNILLLYPTLPTRTIFYIESDTAYYGLPPEEHIVPFQSGFGQTLLVWYNAHGENFHGCFFEKKYLYVLLSQDYKYCGGRGFGYYRNRALLDKAIIEYDLAPLNVIAFRYTAESGEVKDITTEIRNHLKQ